VRETIRAARQRYPGRRLVAVFEPRSYTAQRREFQADYEAALGSADEVVIAGLFHPERYTRETGIDPDGMVETWRASGLTAHHIPDPDRIAERLGDSAGPGDVVLIMSNGGFGGLHGKLLERLGQRAVAEG
jgi:UDP-N-acetylmuramate: L-alanyl-gamma-D-glutamyl-meso-diaminopimelate ligase